jgi:hypothetical protein
LGWTHQPLVPHKLGSSWTWIRWIKGCPSCSLNVSNPSRSILLHIFWTSPFKCFFKLLRPSSCNWPNWHLQWVIGMIKLGVGLILITNSITTPTPRDEQRKYKFTIKNCQFFEELKVQSRTKIEQPKSRLQCWKYHHNSALKLFLKSI